MDVKLKEAIIEANTGADAIQRAPIVNHNTGMKCLRIGDISNHRRYNEWGYTEVNEENYKKYKLEKEDILIARTGSTIGINTLIEQDYKAVYNNGLIRLRIDKSKYSSKFIHYVIQTHKFKNYINGIAFGTTGQPNMKINDLLNFKFHHIPLEIQNKIVKILYSIDKKIKLNAQINDNLFELGMELFKEELDNSNNMETLQNIIKFVKGKMPKVISNIKKGGYEKYLTIACLNAQELKYADKTKMILSNNDLLIVMDGASSGEVYYGGQGIVGSTLARIDCVDNQYISEFVYFAMRYYKGLIKSKNTGSVIPHTDKDFVGTLKIPILNDNRQEKYKIILTRIQKNSEENENLKQLREALLPKLMNEEIDLDKIEKNILSKEYGKLAGESM